MVLLSNVPFPATDPIASKERDEYLRRKQDDPQYLRVTDPWARWFDQLLLQVDSSPSRVGSVELPAQSATIAPTDLSAGALQSGLYTVQWYVRITQAASVSSSLTVTIDWVDGGVTPSFSGAAITGNTTTTTQSGNIMVHVDNNSPIRYSTTYASVGGTPMQYAIYFVLSRVIT